MDKDKLEKYINEMEIPKAQEVLPKECLKPEDECDKEEVCANTTEGKKSADTADRRRFRKYWLGVGVTGLAACVAVASVALLKKPADEAYDISQNGVSEVQSNNSDYDSSETVDDNPKAEYKDGVIGERGEDYISDGDFATDDMFVMESESVSAGEMMNGVGDMVLSGTGDDEDTFTSGWDGEEGTSVNGFEYAAGTLTGGEIRDLRNWDNWLHVMDKEVLGQWDMVPQNRISVYVHNDKVPQNNVRVMLKAGDETVYEARTDASGYAFLFYNYHGASDVKPDTVMVEMANGEFAEYSVEQYANSKNELEIETDRENGDIKLDLMFVMDTTGSMGDELEYLKAEIKDVIERVKDETSATIRTSVNFYRDEGDEYVTKYYDFREDASEIAQLVAQQSADGGGDYEEAVHTALDNAINEHEWGDDSTVRLMFLILDAPPHLTDDIKTQLAELVEKAGSEGIRIIPIVASGAMEDTQQLMRTFAVMTGGTFMFLDDNSGVGYAHDVPVDPSEYTSEYLNEMMIRIIDEYCGIQKDASKVEIPHKEPDVSGQ